MAKRGAINPEFPHLEVRPGRPGTGLGLFTTIAFEKGAFVVEYTGKLLPNSIADELDETHRYLFEVSSKWSIDGSGEENLGRYVNHDCEPNCEADLVGDRVCYFAARDIKAGEELTVDYGIEYFVDYIRPIGCKCATCEKKAAVKSTKKTVSKKKVVKKKVVTKKKTSVAAARK